MTLGYLYDDYGREILIEGKSETLFFFGDGWRRRTISRRALEKNRKARIDGRWFFLDRGAALAHRARARDAEKALEAEQAREVGAQQTFRPVPEATVINVVDTNLRRLKAEMAAAHPDHGGTNDAFIAARKRYLKARAKLGT
jgi:hypothetical protein